MKKKVALFIILLYCFLYVLNLLTPMGFGDDYLYSFIWQGKPEFVPLTEDAIRVSSWQDLLISQWLHYFSWSGRTVNHTLAQFFLWQGKGIFNFFNALIAVVLIIEIYWCINKGKVEYNIQIKKLWWIFFSLWAFTPSYVTVFLWLDGACNYLWPSTLLLGFMRPYILKYYYLTSKTEQSLLFNLVMLCGGVFTGWTNENSICWTILILFCFMLKLRKRNENENWMYSGFIGLLLGYAFLMFAPGNIVRLESVHGLHGLHSLSVVAVKNGIHIFLSSFFKVIVFQFIMWYFCVRALLKLQQTDLKSLNIRKDVLLSKVLCVIAFGMSAVMVLSPEFPLRSGFPGTVQLIIATGILLRIQKEHKIEMITRKTKKIMTYVSYLYFAITFSVAFNNLNNLHLQTEELIHYVNYHRDIAVNSILNVKPFKSITNIERFMSGFHIVENELLENENSWENVAFARYYGIKGIRVSKEGSRGE